MTIPRINKHSAYDGIHPIASQGGGKPLREVEKTTRHVASRMLASWDSWVDIPAESDFD